jgi:hypothetical protein
MLATRLQRAADMKFDVGGGRLSVAQAVLGTALHNAEFHADLPATTESKVGEDEQVQRGILTKADVALSQFAHAQPSNANAAPNHASAVDADAAKALLDALRDPSQTRCTHPLMNAYYMICLMLICFVFECSFYSCLVACGSSCRSTNRRARSTDVKHHCHVR